MPYRFRLIDYNEIFDESKVITNPEPTRNDKFSKGDKFTDNGIFSEEIYGSFDDEKNDKDISTLGWIDLKENYIINPILFPYLKLCIPQLKTIINYNKTIDKNGKIVDKKGNNLIIKNTKEDLELIQDINDEQELHERKRSCEDDYIGLIEFKNRFDEILEKYINIDKYMNEYAFIINNRDKVFINKIPVFSHKLRPAIMIGKTFSYAEINKNYNFILQYLTEMNDTICEEDKNTELLLLPSLFNIQTYTNIIFNEIINEYLKGKKGYLRQYVQGAKLNYIARNVIVPLTKYKLDEVHMPYLTFAELWKFPLINLISKSRGINYNEALKLFNKWILGFYPEMYNYMNELITKTKGGCCILLNRNPSISLGSIQYFRITAIHKDYTNLCLQIPHSCLQMYSGDFDGDVLNIVPIFDIELKQVFSVLSPINFIVDRNNGKFNKKIGFMDDQIFSMYTLNR